MTDFTARAPAKINLGLFLGPTRADGLHELVTVTESLSLADRLTMVPNASEDCVICPGVTGDNLALRALTQFRAHFGWDVPAKQIEIEKQIPIAAGMGGGSADAAAVLRICTLAAESEIDSVELNQLAFELGSDVPSQLAPGIALVSDGGRSVEQLDPLPQHGVLVLPLPHQLSTAEVFREADRLGLSRSSKELDQLRAELRAEFSGGGFPAGRFLVNDLQQAACSLYPPIEQALEAVKETGAKHAFVSGSGPTVVGVFTGPAGVDNAGTAALELRARYERAIGVAPVNATYAAARVKEELCK